MIEYGWRVLFQSDKALKCTLTFNVHEDSIERIDINGGVADYIKKSRKLFSVHELQRVVYYRTECEKGIPQEPNLEYTVIFDFRVSKICQS